MQVVHLRGDPRKQWESGENESEKGRQPIRGLLSSYYPQGSLDLDPAGRI